MPIYVSSPPQDSSEQPELPQHIIPNTENPPRLLTSPQVYLEALSSDPLAFGTQGASSNARTTRKSLNSNAGYGQSLNSGASHGQSLKSGLTSRQSLNSGSSAQQSIKRGPSSPEQRSNRTGNPPIQFILPSDLPDLSDLFSTEQVSNSTTLGPNSQLSLAKEALL